MTNISSNSADVPAEVDIIVAGGGSAGCTLAARLAKANPNVSILIIEAGINNKDVASVIYPALFLTNLVPGSKTAAFHKCSASKHLNGREAIVPTGGCLGGGSSINCMMYGRGQAVDYDSWNTEGWRMADLLPLLKKTETYHGPDPNNTHGHDGEFHVSAGFASKPFMADCLNAVAQVGMKEVPDANDLVVADGVQRWVNWIHPDTGLRQDAAHVLIHPLLERGDTSLKILTEHKVVKVLTEGGRAVGVEFAPSAATASASKVVRARKLVVLSSGALGTPSILERSGIGNKSLLNSLNIPVVSDLPGVGENYIDHTLLFNAYTTNSPPEDSFDPFLDGRRPFETEIAALSDASKPRYIAWNSIDIAAKVRPTEVELATARPVFQEIWAKDFADPTRPMAVMIFAPIHVGDHSNLPRKQYMSAVNFPSYSYSRGSIHITSVDADAPANFDSGMLSHPWDVEAHVLSYKRQREVIRRMKAFAGPDGIIAGPKFLDSGKAKHWPTDGSPTEYTKEDNDAIEDFVRSAVETCWHSAGTAAMKGREDGGVVDSELNVYGVEGLKVADISIMPSMVAANVYSTALLVGEKAACIIAEELGLDI
ncbi:hypothetical protein Dda_9296 [Drechslerella dactyloides]|uniref:Glucose-methanol-choline oxidoreductase N-terminal domain-containing protein n=1 Tax=Drechslerella dactyloides TaxID=74499 RepID=A0AAD6IT97_DREDA|nr:hypothetical protein Dda_9296 [Drechslerella dactyloides]